MCVVLDYDDESLFSATHIIVVYTPEISENIVTCRFYICEFRYSNNIMSFQCVSIITRVYIIPWWGPGEELKSILNIPKPSEQNVTYGRRHVERQRFSTPAWFIISARVMPKSSLKSGIWYAIDETRSLRQTDQYNDHNIVPKSRIRGAAALLFIFVVISLW